MAKVKLTKGELKRQRDNLGQFNRYLPTLQLKRQQLQIRASQMYRSLIEHEEVLAKQEADIRRWVGLLADPFLPQSMDLKAWVLPEKVETGTENIAGAIIPVFKGALFRAIDYDLYDVPLWVDKAVARISQYMALLAQIIIIRRQIEVIERELRVTTQRVNLFEKVKIPEAQENIRVIRISLGDQLANAVGISKAAKNRLEE